jgi:hypothetical protein
VTTSILVGPPRLSSFAHTPDYVQRRLVLSFVSSLPGVAASPSQQNTKIKLDNKKKTMATPRIAVDRSDGAPVDRSTTPTGVADFDFALPMQGDDDDAWAEVKTPLHKASLPLEDASDARDAKDARHSRA